MSLYWKDKVSDWRPLHEDDERAEVQPRDWRPRQRTGDHWHGVLRGWADDVLHHQRALHGLNARHAEFWRRRV
jgi:hypothetical protein